MVDASTTNTAMPKNSPRVLVAEDDSALRLLVRSQLKRLGLECETANDGQEAVDMANAGYDLIFMDLSMPNMDGLEATTKIRQIEIQSNKKRTPIVGLTAFDDRAKCVAAGMDDYFQKPMSLQQLKDVTEKFLL